MIENRDLVGDDEAEIENFLCDSATYQVTEKIELIRTHISIIALTADRAYKWKRRIKLPYLDFFSPNGRKAAYQNELHLNRRTAPSIYIGLRQICRDTAGRLNFDNGTFVDWVLEMKRFDANSILDKMAVEGKITEPLAIDLASIIASFHSSAKSDNQHGGSAALNSIASENYDCLSRVCGASYRGNLDFWYAKFKKVLLTHTALLEERKQNGSVRHCHGDLHLGNIFVLDGVPILFDCIEFSDSLSVIDVLYDLAFLLMDFKFRGLGEKADAVLRHYLIKTQDFEGLPLLPLFMSLRASTRSLVSMSISGEVEKEMSLGIRYLKFATEMVSQP